jgi:hydrogenase expression/formation protein HypC
MCLGEICEVTEVRPGGRALVRGDRREQEVLLMTVSGTVAPGDWLVCHSGFALDRISAEEAREARAIRSTPSTQTEVSP